MAISVGGIGSQVLADSLRARVDELLQENADLRAQIIRLIARVRDLEEALSSEGLRIDD